MRLRRVGRIRRQKRERMGVRRKGTGTEKPQGGTGRGHSRGGGECLPQRKMRTSQDSP